MRFIMVFLCWVSFVSAIEVTNNPKQSIVMKFDLLIDGEVTIDDPRIKSIIYSSNKKSLVKISYFNQNAKNVANKIYGILDIHGVSVSKPELGTDAKNTKYVLVWINY